MRPSFVEKGRPLSIQYIPFPYSGISNCVSSKSQVRVESQGPKSWLKRSQGQPRSTCTATNRGSCRSCPTSNRYPSLVPQLLAPYYRVHHMKSRDHLLSLENFSCIQDSLRNLQKKKKIQKVASFPVTRRKEVFLV